MGTRRTISVLTLLLASATAQVPTLHSFVGAGAGDRFGSAVARAGDVDGDGRPDVVVGAPQADANGPNSGAAYVFSGATGALLHSFVGESVGAFFGDAVAGAGDVDGDGRDDVIVGAPHDAVNGPDSGSARVFSGATGAVLWAFFGAAPATSLGASVAGAGDVDGDGFADLVVGAPNDDAVGFNVGSVRVYSGATGVTLHTFVGNTGGDEFGFAVDGAGDVNADGFDDVVVGSRGANVNGGNAGRVAVYSGFDGALLHDFAGDDGGDELGVSVSGAGDVNGDGFADVIGGAHRDEVGGTDSGLVRVWSGFDGSVMFDFAASAPGTFFGYSVDGGGDVDGDGVADFVVGSPFDDAAGIEAGSVTVFSGANGGVLFRVLGRDPIDELGFSVAIAGDVNGDGLAEVIAGARLDDAGTLDCGTARVLTGTLGLACAAGNVSVDGGGGGPWDVLLVNGEPGNCARVASVGSAPFTVEFVKSPDMPFEVVFTLWGKVGLPAIDEGFTVPFQIGTLCFAPCLTNPPGDPDVVLITDSLGAGGACASFVPSAGTPFLLQVPGIPIAVEFALQGVMYDSAASPVPLSISNLVLVDTGTVATLP